MTEPRSQNDFLRHQFDRSVAIIVEELRDLADTIEREGRVPDPELDRPRSFVSQASVILSKIANAQPHLGLGLLIERSAEADALWEKEA